MKNPIKRGNQITCRNNVINAMNKIWAKYPGSTEEVVIILQVEGDITAKVIENCKLNGFSKEQKEDHPW